jgi:cytochrome P450
MTVLEALIRPDVLADPYPLYHRLRAEDPVHLDDPPGIWVLTRYADIAAVLRDPRFSSSRRALQADGAGPPPSGAGGPVARVFGLTMLFSDPPDHTRLRGLVNKAFTPRVVESLRPRIQRLVDELLDRVQEAGRMDVIADLAWPLPVTVIAELLGLPPEDRDKFKAWSTDLVSLTAAEPGETIGERAQRSLFELAVYLNAVVAQRRAAPREDLISLLIAAEEKGDVLSTEELLANLVLLLLAGHETTTNLIGNGLLALLRHPDQLQRLRDDPALIPTAVEELLRFDSPVQGTRRITTAAVEIGGRRIPAGRPVVVLLGAANRDPAQFPDPDRLDLGRRDNRHLSFGQGIHYCLGAPLARLEGQIAFSTVLRRLPRLELATDRLVWRDNPVLRGLTALPVTF